MVEVRLNSRSHRIWYLNNINLLAPIPISIWKVWANLCDGVVKAYEDKAVNAKIQTVEDQAIANAFPLALYKHHKCTTLAVSVHAKQEVLTCPPRQPQHTSKLWNCRRPYLCCQCSQNAKSGSRRNMILFDHSIWIMLNNLDHFFDAHYPSLASKFGALITWISFASLIVVYLQIIFMAFRRLMEVAALEFAANPNEKFLARYANALRARQIKRSLKPTSFSLETTLSPSPVNYSRKRRLNMNVTPDNQNPHSQSH